MKILTTFIFCYFSFIIVLSGAPQLGDEINKYDCIFTAVLKEGRPGRYFAVDVIIKGVVTPNNTSSLDLMKDYDRIDVGQRVIVFGFEETNELYMILLIDKNGFFKFKLNEQKEHKLKIEELSDILIPSK